MRRLLAFIVLLLPLSLSVCGQTASRWRDSLSVINRQIAVSPYSSDLHLRKAAINIELEQWKYAVEEYGTVLSHDPSNLAALFYRAYANTHLRHYNLARNDYEAFLRLAPVNMEARLGLAHVLVKMERSADAMDQYNRLVELHPDSALVYAARAGYESERGVYDAALYDWDVAVRLAPDNTEYIISRADVLLRLGKKAEARRSLDSAVKKGVPRAALRDWYKRCK